MGLSSINWLYGVDGVKNGWVVARASSDLTDVSLHFVQKLEPLFWRVVRDGDLLTIDIPMGLPVDGLRCCDREARSMLKRPRSSSVFAAPVRAALEGDSYEEASHLSQLTSGRKLSQQTFHLLPKLREVDGLMSPERQQRIREAHPEVSFMVLADASQGLSTPKKSTAGKRERTAVLRRHLPHVDVPGLLDSMPGRRLSNVDDRLDALACLLSAWRIANGVAIRIPHNHLEIDAQGLRMEIIA